MVLSASRLPLEALDDGPAGDRFGLTKKPELVAGDAGMDGVLDVAVVAAVGGVVGLRDIERVAGFAVGPGLTWIRFVQLVVVGQASRLGCGAA